MRYRDFITIAILSVILAGGYTATLQAAQAPVECPNGSCVKISDTDRQRQENPSHPVEITAQDITIQYRCGGPNGQKEELHDKGKLHAGDRFTIHVTMKKQMYLYLFHFGTTGKVTELLEAYKRDNHISSGTTLILPSETKHFEMDNNIGTETMYVIASVNKLPFLMAFYRKEKLALADLPGRSTGKDFFVRDNPKPSETETDITGGAYRHIMKIDHIAQ